MKKLQLLIYILLSQFSYSQTFQWSKAGNSTGANKMASDKAGNFYVADGHSVSKYDFLGNFIWKQNISGGYFSDLDCDSIGNTYIIGNFDSLTIGTYVLAAPSNQANTFLVKYNSNGSFQWVKRSYNNRDASAHAITVDKQGNPIIIGRFLDSLHLDDFFLDAPETNQVFLAKYSPSGFCLWAKHLESWSFGGGGNGPKIKSDKLGNSYISGHFINHATFGNITIPAHGEYADNIFLAKFDLNGTFLWAQVLGGSVEEISGPMDVDSIGNTYISGYFSSAQAYFGSYTLTTGSYNYFTAKYDSDGTCLWAKYRNSSGICAASDGYYTNDPGLVTKYNDAGDLQWTKTVSGAANNAMVATSTDVFITGSYNGPVSFDTCNLTSTANQMYIAKLGDVAVPTSIKEMATNTFFSVYPNPASSSITLSINTSKSKGVFVLNICNTSGSLVYTETLKEVQGSFTKQINLSFLPKGAYFIELQFTSLNSSVKKESTKIILQ